MAVARGAAALLAAFVAAIGAAQSQATAAGAAQAQVPMSPTARAPALPDTRAEDAACPGGQARLRLAVVDPPPVLSTTEDVWTLQAASGAPHSATLRHLGLTTSRVEWQVELETRYSARAEREQPAAERDPKAGSGVCAVPARITLRLVQTEHRIRIAREIPPGSCLFRAVEAHERRHAAANRATLQRAAEAARRAAEAWAPGARGRGATIEAAVAAL